MIEDSTERMSVAEYRRRMGLEVERTPKQKRHYAESELQRSVVRALAMLGIDRWCVYFAVANERVSRIQRMYLAANGVRAGVADLVFHWQGGSGFIEMKTEKGRLSPKQKEFRDWCNSCGIEYHVARTVSEVVDIVQTWAKERDSAETYQDVSS